MRINWPLRATTIFANIFRKFRLRIFFHRVSLLDLGRYPYPAIPRDFHACVREIHLSFRDLNRWRLLQINAEDDPQPRALSASAGRVRAPADQAGPIPIRSSTPALPAIAPKRPASSW